MVLAHKRRTWLDNVVLKHQSSALVPIFDPRPGKAIIPTLVDMPIPSPGMSVGVCVCVCVCMCVYVCVYVCVCMCIYIYIYIYGTAQR